MPRKIRLSQHGIIMAMIMLGPSVLGQGVIARWLSGFPWIIPLGRTGCTAVSLKAPWQTPSRFTFCLKLVFVFHGTTLTKPFKLGLGFMFHSTTTDLSIPFPSLSPTSVLCKSSSIATDSASLQTTVLPKKLCAQQAAPHTVSKKRHGDIPTAVFGLAHSC